jgi:hypothetical protein
VESELDVLARWFNVRRVLEESEMVNRVMMIREDRRVDDCYLEVEGEPKPIEDSYMVKEEFTKRPYEIPPVAIFSRRTSKTLTTDLPLKCTSQRPRSNARGYFDLYGK